MSLMLWNMLATGDANMSQLMITSLTDHPGLELRVIFVLSLQTLATSYTAFEIQGSALGRHERRHFP